jgi:hypothetical protein
MREVVRKATQMRFGRASLVLAFLAVIGLCVAGTASSAGTQAVTATTATVTGASCSTPVQKGKVTVTHCTGGVETWFGDITGTGTYSYDRITNLITGVRVVVNGVETIDNACVLGTCGGSLYSRWNENDLPSGDLRLEQSFRGGTGAFTKAHGSIRVVDPVNFIFSGHVGI